MLRQFETVLIVGVDMHPKPDNKIMTAIAILMLINYEKIYNYCICDCLYDLQ